MEIVVECYAGAGYPERPRALVIDGERLQVREVEAQARTPEGVRFRVRLSDGRVFLLLYRDRRDVWTVRPA